ncbi:MAG: HDIG domain-containing metalloprotein [Anaerolineaceae bacterium]
MARAGKVILFLVVCTLAFFAITLPDMLAKNEEIITVGSVATQERFAPYSINFESKIFTERARKEAAAAVQPIYLPSDPFIAREQLQKLSSAINYISSVRADSLANPEQKLIDLQNMTVFKLPAEDANRILNLEADDWTAISAEANRVLELVLRDNIRANAVSEYRDSLPAKYGRAFLPNETIAITSLISQLIVPTSLYSEEQTAAAREAARNMIEPVTRQIINGEVLLRRGQIVKEEDLEALNVFGYSNPTNPTNQLIRSGIVVAIFAAIVVIYYRRHADRSFVSFKSIVLISSLFLLFLGLARFLIIDRTVLPYLYPFAAFGITVAIVFNTELSVILTLGLAVLTVFGKSREAELLVYFILPSIAGILAIGRARRLSSFIVAGLLTSLTAIGVVFAFRYADMTTDLAGFSTLIASAGFSGLASASLAILVQQILSAILDLPTALQLLDISRPDHPLLQLILRNAPGSYQHSLLVSNLAEQAAEAIGADRLLVRVGTLFHDAGKANNPPFFIENQMKDKIDSHDTLDPTEAARTIISHVTDGVALAKRYRLPTAVIDFIREHHGTMITRYQLAKAVELAGGDESAVNIANFTYPGPAPRSRETAILMLADGTEARARANSPKTDEEIRKLIDDTINYCKDQHQLDNTDLTLKDLNTIANAFFNALQRSYHPRIKYPEARNLGITEPIKLSETIEIKTESLEGNK